MASYTDQSAPSPQRKLVALCLRLAGLIFAWMGAMYCVAFVDLGGGNVGIREIYAHAQTDPNLMLTTTIAVLFGWFAGQPASKPGDSWIYARPLPAQLLVGAVLVSGVLAMLFLR